ncbi:uncharacterized protein LOC111622121 isoform X3 [Centruroides sculpturatus]|uniref:uncharacterized protein LOC111622121 isoform X3 n=1 Tax=Centruroides sculpturatus TaxID=218467 RepID=UPI000C6D14AC|nr:uncharacterized protein LOC111622121 isoform X3 [Centruroides sculpturatus]
MRNIIIMVDHHPSSEVLEDAYIAKDPFAPKGHKLFLLLGSHCSVCNNVVCQSKILCKVCKATYFKISKSDSKGYLKNLIAGFVLLFNMKI